MIEGGFFDREQSWPLARLQALACALHEDQPLGSPLINAEPGRAHFALGLLRANLAAQGSLLPASESPEHLQALQSRYAAAQYPLPASLVLPKAVADSIAWWDSPNAVLCFTSGSTGEPKLIAKSWRALSGSVQGMAAAAGWQAGATKIVATVPPQHMFGLEMSVLSVLVAGCWAHVSKPFFPADVMAAMTDAQGATVLVSTPLHLRALLKSGLEWPRLEQIVSATAPLDQALARSLEAASDAQVLEVYGSTETGAVACRHTARDDVWTLFGNVEFAEDGALSAEHLPDACRLQDEIEVLDKRRFRLLGRPQNMLKVAGKRYSLDALTHELQSIDGVCDAVALVPPASERPAALVVSSQLEPAQIRQILSHRLDPVFLPRPLLMVEAIPRNATGKLQRAELLKLLARG